MTVCFVFVVATDIEMEKKKWKKMGSLKTNTLVSHQVLINFHMQYLLKGRCYQLE